MIYSTQYNIFCVAFRMICPSEHVLLAEASCVRSHLDLYESDSDAAAAFADRFRREGKLSSLSLHEFLKLSIKLGTILHRDH